MDETAKREDTACSVCPLTLLPPKNLSHLIRPPFRHRHPIIFWTLLVAIAVTVAGSFASFGDDDSNATQESLALVSITGTINNVEPNLEWIRRIYSDPLVKGILIRVDSPGGGASASQELYAALASLARKKPVAVSMGATAASGGLMVSMAAEKIFANAATLTGSIGVRMDIPQLQGLMGKLGLGQETLVSGPYKDAASFTKPLTEEDRDYLQELVMKLHNQFVDIIAQERRLPREKVLALANGKIYTGQEALELGLIDAIGGQDEALAYLAEKTGVPKSRPILKRKVSRTRLVSRLLDSSGDATIAQILLWFHKLGIEQTGENQGDAAPKPLISY